MTNEELAVAIAQGRDDLQLQLWDQVKAYVHMRAYKVVTLSGGAGGATVQDLEQSGFLAMLRAVEKYDPARGSFLSCLTYYLQQEFAAVGGYRSTKRDPLDTCLSLDAPVTGGEDGGEDMTYIDTIEDPQDLCGEVEEAIYTTQLHAALDSAIGEHLTARQAEIMREQYWQNKSASAIARERGVSFQNVTQQLHRGLQLLRRSSAARSLRDFLDEENLYAGTGLRRFNVTGTSAVERAVLRREDAVEREARREEDVYSDY